MRHCLLIFAAFIMIAGAVSMGAQTLLLNQAYLNQFPSVARVRAEMRGSDDVDSYARLVAAVTVINDFMVHDLVTAPNGGQYPMPPAADRVHEQYRVALTRLEIDEPEPPSKDPRFGPLRDKYENDPAFADALLQKFFTPQFRIDYYAWTRKRMPAVATTTTAGTVKTSGGSAVPPDASVAKAKAAKVDIGLFAGTIKFGDQLLLPRCPYSQNFVGLPEIGDVTQDCEDIPPPVSGAAADAINALGSVLVPGSSAKAVPTPDPNIRRIVLIDDHRPSWMSGDGALLRISSTGIERVVIPTKGKDVQKRVAEDLIAKYGVAHFTEEGTVTPDSGNAFKVSNLSWVLPGLHVEYRVLDVDENGRVHVDGTGFVRIETEAAYSRRIADEKKDKAKKQVL
jgi:hypothetical protein